MKIIREIENNIGRKSGVKLKNRQLSPCLPNQLHLKSLSFLLTFRHTGLPRVSEHSSYTTSSYDFLYEKLLSPAFWCLSFCSSGFFSHIIFSASHSAHWTKGAPALPLSLSHQPFKFSFSISLFLKLYTIFFCLYIICCLL